MDGRHEPRLAAVVAAIEAGRESAHDDAAARSLRVHPAYLLPHRPFVSCARAPPSALSALSALSAPPWAPSPSDSELSTLPTTFLSSALERMSLAWDRIWLLPARSARDVCALRAARAQTTSTLNHASARTAGNTLKCVTLNGDLPIDAGAYCTVNTSRTTLFSVPSWFHSLPTSFSEDLHGHSWGPNGQ